MPAATAVFPLVLIALWAICWWSTLTCWTQTLSFCLWALQNLYISRCVSLLFWRHMLIDLITAALYLQLSTLIHTDAHLVQLQITEHNGSVAVKVLYCKLMLIHTYITFSLLFYWTRYKVVQLWHIVPVGTVLLAQLISSGSERLEHNNAGLQKLPFSLALIPTQGVCHSSCGYFDVWK